MAFIGEPQDHLHELKAAGLIKDFAWDRAEELWYVRLQSDDTVLVPDSFMGAFARGMVSAVTAAVLLTPRERENLNDYRDHLETWVCP